jgi:hypothetical protein
VRLLYAVTTDLHSPMRARALRHRRLTRYQWPIAITATVAAASIFALPPILDVAQPAAPVAANLHTSLAYDLLAPVSNVFDALTLLSPAQYYATLLSCAVAFLVIGIRGRTRPAHWIRASARFVGAAVAITGLLLVAERPMAAIVLPDSDLLTVDFHSHTSASHDGRAGFDAERNREWHSSAGFNAVYVTDHRTFDGALEAQTANPAVAGLGTVLLPGVELRDIDEHPILIGVDPRRMLIESPDWKDAAVKADGGPAPPMIFLAMPGNLLRIPSSITSGAVRLAGLEISDGSPRGLAQSARDRRAILALAARLDVALISASDNHGWGRTAPAWSVMRIPGWRAMSPTALDIAIRRTIVDRGFRSVQVIARRTTGEPATAVGFALGGVAVAALMLRTMTLPDRISWVAWTWVLCIVRLRVARTNGPGLRTRVQQMAGRSGRRPVKAAA